MFAPPRWIVSIALFVGLFSGASLRAETARFLSVPASPAPVTLAVALPQGLPVDPGAAYRLVQADRPEIVVPVQFGPSLAADGTPTRTVRLFATLPANAAAEGPRQFRLEKTDISPPTSPLAFQEVSDASLRLVEGETPLWTYNFGTITGQEVPTSDPRRTRACYLHPIWGLHGEVLSDDFPKDHYHHHGIFWAWPHVGIDGEEYDLWTGKNIDQRFVRWLQRETGPVAAVLAVENGWFVGEREVLCERVCLRSYRTSETGRLLDLEFTWIPRERPITLLGAEGKSYGGMALRFAPREKTQITVPQGAPTEDLPDTPLPWADLSAQFAGAPGPSGAAILIDPQHPNFPPTWLTRHYGILCVGWPGVQPRTIAAGEPIRLNYRVWIHDGAADVPTMEHLFQAYQAATSTHWE